MINNAQRRLKEIGVRKVNGAKVSEVMVMLNVAPDKGQRIIKIKGLLALVTYAAEQRIKEIGIRKINGASISEIRYARWEIQPLPWVLNMNWVKLLKF